MTTRPSFDTLQRQFARYIRDPQNAEPVGQIPRARMQVYADLMFRNIESTLRNCFPVLHSVLTSVAWHSLVRDFFGRHRARTPLFPQIPHEFVKFLEESRRQPEDPGYLNELAYYEWLELAVGHDEREIADQRIDPDADVLMDIPILNPIARRCRFAYPVHRIGPTYRPVSPPIVPTYLIVFRARNDGVGFAELTPVTARLLDMVADNHSGKNGRDLLLAIGDELRHPRPDTLIQSGRDILHDLLLREVLIGAHRAQ
jgi:uncharacterized protein